MLITKKNKCYLLCNFIKIIFSIILTSCSNQLNTINSKNIIHDNYKTNNTYNNSITLASQDEFEKLIKLINTKSKIMNQYINWKNVIYRLGGTTKNGIDCSSFVQRTFFDQFGIHIPRTTSEQEFLGKRVKLKSLEAGDIVLFRINNTMKHVGIYIDNGKFVHVSSSNGVVISKITNSYWSKRYYTGRRIINNT
ncbi:Murein DD-endopeptidase MepS/Murein LD-carboxypeptidase [Candidatus Providencia siddallii]|uniref:Murein DD-endopeptidase MepS/Murein LD-carboxypeptidase n=1 Tax=Candidatus Providencia siddallii TaxID=1715285 RepID=A0A0M6W7K1_9GAMM|nr:Murein DD-endopeptidase MepS/Murein LD-carboxypeptidase [Candidatus Providencia siddallii]